MTINIADLIAVRAEIEAKAAAAAAAAPAQLQYARAPAASGVQPAGARPPAVQRGTR